MNIVTEAMNSEVVAKWMDSLTVPDFPTEDPELLDKYAKFMQGLDAQTGAMGGVDLFDRGKGLKSWIQGSVLLKMKPLAKKRKGIVGHGAWSPFLKAIAMDETTAYNVRRIANRFSREQAKTLGHTAMLAALYPSLKATNDNRSDETGAETSKSKTPQTKTITERSLESRMAKIKTATSQIDRDLTQCFVASDTVEAKAALAYLEDADESVAATRANLDAISKHIVQLMESVHSELGKTITSRKAA